MKFLPWIGDKYEDGIYYDETGELRYGNGKGKKVLVLGESFYWGEEDDDDDDGNGNNNSDASLFVADLIKQVISEILNLISERSDGLKMPWLMEINGIYPIELNSGTILFSMITCRNH